MKNVAVIILTGILISTPAFSQKKKKELMPVKGTVTAFTHYSVLNAEVISKKTKTTTLTDSMGRFEMMAPAGDQLTISAAGFEKNRRKVQKENEPFEVNLIFEDTENNKEIAVAYGHIRKEDLTYALSNYTDLNNDFAKYTSIEQLFQTELIGATVGNQGGGLKVYLRGSESTGSISGFDHSALFVLDGVPTDRVDHLNPKDIKAITLLKSGEAGMYGSRASHGAVLIETK